MGGITRAPDIDAILRIATRLPVFPCNKDKQPLTEHGFLDASQDAEQIRSWWRRFPEALVAVPTGSKTGLIAVDYDPGKADAASKDWIESHTTILTGTRAHSTRRGGRHWIFHSSDEYASGKDVYLDGQKRCGLDIRASGGYVIWWPAHGGSVIGEIAELPESLLADRRRIIPRDRHIPPSPRQLLVRARSWAQDRARTISALEHIDPTDRDTWIRIGLAIHSASSGDEDGFQIWHAWSCGGLTEITPPTYVNENDCRYNWQSFNKYVNGKESVVTLGTLFALAKEGGYDPTPKPPDDSRFAPIDSYADADAPQDLTKEEWSEPTPKSDLKPKLLFVSFAEIVARNSEPEWLLYKILEKRVIGVLAGPRGSFKSFVALDWLMRSALQKQSCLMLSGEGGGLGRRIDAWMRTFAGNLDLGSLPVQGLERPINLNVDETYLDIMEAIEAMPHQPDLIVVDTLSKFSGGLDENSTKEMAAFIDKISNRLRYALDSTVLLVAHTGHADSSRPRGSSTLMANPDAEYMVSRPDPIGMQITVSRERFKDTASLSPLVYDAEIIDLSRVDRSGDAVTSLILKPNEQATPTTRRGKATGQNQKAAIAGIRQWAVVNPSAMSIGTEELKMALGNPPRQRRFEMVRFLVEIGVLANSVGGHSVNRSLLD